MLKKIRNITALSITAMFLSSCALGQAIYDEEARKICDEISSQNAPECRNR